MGIVLGVPGEVLAKGGQTSLRHVLMVEQTGLCGSRFESHRYSKSDTYDRRVLPLPMRDASAVSPRWISTMVETNERVHRKRPRQPIFRSM
jgi:hypothetical protein